MAPSLQQFRDILARRTIGPFGNGNSETRTQPSKSADLHSACYLTQAEREFVTAALWWYEAVISKGDITFNNAMIDNINRHLKVATEEWQKEQATQ